MTKELEGLREQYFVFLKPIDEESKRILANKKYENNKSVAQMWRDSID